MIDEKKLIEYIKGMPNTCNLFRWRSPKRIKQGLVSIIAHEPKVSEWIPCSVRLPEEPKENPILNYKPLELYLVSIEGADYSFRAFWNGEIFFDGFSKLENVIEWQPLPEVYKK